MMGSAVTQEQSRTNARLRRLLVVEDSPSDLLRLERELARNALEFSLEVVQNADEMHAALQTGPWDAILSDHSLPQFNSSAALEVFRATGLDIPFIIVSGAIGEEQVVASMKAGAKDFVSKANLTRLVPVLEREWSEAAVRAERLKDAATIEALNRERDIRLQQRSTLLDITSAAVSNLDRAGLFKSLFESMRRPLACEGLFLWGASLPVTFLEAASDGRTVATELVMDDRLLSGKEFELGYCIGSLADPHGFPLEIFTSLGVRHWIGVPLIAKGAVIGILAPTRRVDRPFLASEAPFIQEIAAQIALAIENMLAFEEIGRLKARLEEEKEYLLEEINTEHNFEEMIGSSTLFRRALDLVRQAAPTSAPVLISGETGTGKELVARALHNLSPRKNRPMVKVNCAAISTALLESELFGHVKGAFTGAIDRRIGRFELANGGTLFLDEIGEMPLEAQAKLLRAIQEKEFEPVGSSKTIRVDTRIIAATNRSLESAIQTGTFRADLYYRLNVVPVHVPPLRERREDIPSLISFFLERFSRQFGKPMDGVSREAMECLLSYSWPGNVRELENLLARAVVLSPTRVIGAGILGLPGGSGLLTMGSSPPADSDRIQEVERRHILHVLEASSWVIEGASGAAARLCLHPSTLRGRMKKLGIRRNTDRGSSRQI
jgi:formate hydrogenlyase transcriptional activator